jgi:hypothetical protein
MPNPIDTILLNSMTDGKYGIDWLQSLAAAGVRRSDSETAVEAYALAQRVHELDEEIQATMVVDKEHFELPKLWWVWVPALYTGLFLWSMDAEHYEDRLSKWMIALVCLGVLAVWVLFVKYSRELSLRRVKAQLRPRLKGERAAAMVDLLRARDACVAQYEASMMEQSLEG